MFQQIGTAPLYSPSNGTSTTDSTPTFDWGAASGATHYTVQVSTDPSVANAAAPRWIKKDLTSTARTWSSSFTPNATAGSTPSQLPSGTYYWRIKSMDGVISSGPSASFSSMRNFTVSASAPSTPSISLASTSSNGSYAVSWNTPSGSPTSYQLQETSPSGATYTQTSTSKSFSGKLAGNYTYTVRACNSSGCSSYSSSKTINVPLGTASLISPANGVSTSDGSQCFSWDSASNAAYYTAQVSSDTNFNASSHVG